MIADLTVQETLSPPSPSLQRFTSYNQFLQRKLGGRTYKVVVSSGFTCPTRDGTIDKGGCAFCDVRGSSSFHGKTGRGKEVIEQLQSRIDPIRVRFNAARFLAYFQSYTNTYGELDEMKELYEAALSVQEISGICIGTRPDCLPDAVIDYLQELAQRTFVSLELGVQSFEVPSLEWLERGHDGESSLQAIRRLRERAPDVHVGAHLIFGSPPDSPTMAKDAALTLNSLGVHGVKLHQLMILQRTKLAERLREEPFEILSLEKYGEIVTEFLEWLSPDIAIERLYALATHPEELVAPDWSKRRWYTHNFLHAEFDRRDVWQGKRLGAARPNGVAEREV